MHRYFSRRPYSIFAELVHHYSDPSDIILDPFCGGGVTLVEGVLQGRRVIGFDINPLATFVTRTELANVDLNGLKEAQAQVFRDFRPASDKLFATVCRHCRAPTIASWFEYSALAECEGCAQMFIVATAKKQGVGRWECPYCGRIKRFSPNSETTFKLIDVLYNCKECGREEVAEASANDSAVAEQMVEELQRAESNGLWIPSEEIPDCNMQRESALFKKGIIRFRQLFTPRHLIALGLLREIILRQHSPFQEWLLLAFSSTLRYANRMVTRNPSWRGERPLEWVKPGFWLPPVHLEANVLQEFSRRCDAIVRGKRDYLSKLPANPPPSYESAHDVLATSASSFHVSTCSATSLPLPDRCIDVIITDPPYGSYVHYADLSNFWSVWLPEIDGMGRVIENSKEAVFARKNFPGAKSSRDYQQILEQCFTECARVLKPDSYMVLTFNNREPRAWAALLIAATKAGFETLPDGLLYQKGIPSYRHTAQSRRHGSVIGDFILSFKKLASNSSESFQGEGQGNHVCGTDLEVEVELVNTASRILQENGPQKPDELVARLYVEFQPILMKMVRIAVAMNNGAVEKLMNEFDQVKLLDSQRRQLLERHFRYERGKWLPRSSQ
jgi:hypothetical protein